MANVRVIPIEQEDRTLDELAALNVEVLVSPEASLWTKDSNGELVLSDNLLFRAGSWALQISTTGLSSSDSLTAGNLDVVPMPNDYFPDTYWTRNGQDLIPRS